MKFTQAILASTLILGATFAPTASAFSFAPQHLHRQKQQCVGAITQLYSSIEQEATATDDAAVTTNEEASSTAIADSIIEGMPSISPATSLPNQIYNWRGYNVRYQVSGPPDADHTLLLVHGLFVNSDHWRKTLTGLQQENEADGKTYRVYALDLLGSGWSSKPFREDPAAQLINGENGRFVDCDSVCYRESQEATATRSKSTLKKKRGTPILENIPLGTAAGGQRLASELELRHPLRSPYNFYTWAEQIADFTHDIIHKNESSETTTSSNKKKKVTLVANSIGTMSSLQSILDEPQLFNGCFVINPNFRELHSAEVPFTKLTMPLVRQIQSLLRTKGHGLFETLATPNTVKEILKEPYAVTDVIDDELIDVLLTPLLTKGADEVVFDTLSYSAGPLPEQQLSSVHFPKRNDCPVWIVYGKDDPWTPSKRVENLKLVGCPNSALGKGPVERVLGLDSVGHCPHDESSEEVNALIMEFLDRLA